MVRKHKNCINYKKIKTKDKYTKFPKSIKKNTKYKKYKQVKKVHKVQICLYKTSLKLICH